MPKSSPWVAPEWHHRGITPSEAKKMDAYSFGTLCLWLLLYNTQGNPSHKFEDLLSKRTASALAHDSFRDLNSEEMAPVLTHLSTLAPGCLDYGQRTNLKQLFDITLASDPSMRTSDFRQVLQVLAPHR
jgi:hypothetical protein